MLPILFDVLIVASLLFFTFRGAKKGFVLTLCSLVAVLVAIIGANIVADLATPVVAKAIEPTIQQTIQETLEQQFAHGTVGAQEALTALRDKGGFYLWIADALKDVDVDQLGVAVLPALSHHAAQAATIAAAQLARGIIFIIAFVLISIAWWILSHTLDLVTKLPVLDTLNSGLGGGIGLVKGVVIAYVAVWCLYSLSGYVSPEVMERTYLFRFLALHSPLELLHLT